MRPFNVFKLPGEAPAPIGAVYALMGFLMPVVAAFNARALVPIIAVCAVAVLTLGWRGGHLATLRRVDTLLVLAMAGYMAVFLAASLGAPDFADTGVSFAKLAGIVIIAWVLISMQRTLSPADLGWLFCAVLLGFLVTCLWLLVDVVSDSALSIYAFNLSRVDNELSDRIRYYGYFWYKSASTVLTIMALVLGVYAQRRGQAVCAVGLAGLAFVSALVIDSRTAAAGVVIALAAGFIYSLLGRHRVRVTVAALALAFLAPFLLNSAAYSPPSLSAQLDRSFSSSNSVVYRLHIWKYTAEKIMEKPLLGWGAGASKRLGNDDVGNLTDPKFGVLGEPIPLHPHNGVLQIWLEFGAAGALMAFLLFARGIYLADRLVTTTGGRTWMFAVIALIGSFFGFNFSISSSWWLASVVALISLVSAFARRPAVDTAP